MQKAMAAACPCPRIFALALACTAVLLAVPLASEAQAFQRKLVMETEAKVVESLQGRGVTQVPIDVKPLQEAVAGYYQDFGKQIGGMALIDQAKATR